MNKILIIAPNWIGDAVMTLPLIQELYKSNQHIDVLAPKITAPVYKFCSYINNIIEHNLEHKKLQLIQRLNIIRILNNTKYNTVYILPNSFKSLIIPLLARIPNKIGYSGEWPRKYFLTRYKKTQGKKLSMVKHYYALADSKVISEKDIYPKLKIDENKANECVRNFNLNNYIIIAIGAEYGLSKQWPLENFKELIELIIAKSNVNIVLLGSNKDKQDADNLVFSNRVINLCGQTTLAQAILIIKKSQQLLTHDSGLMHIACALNIKTVAIYGSTSPYHTPPLSDNSSYIWLNLSCSPCFERVCPLGHYACLKNISPANVFDKMF